MKSGTRAGLFLLALLVAGSLLWMRHQHRAALLPHLLLPPTPVLSSVEVTSDAPSGGDFSAAQWRVVTRIEAEAFAVLDGDFHCATAWQDAVTGSDHTDVIQQAQLPGKSGIADWHQMRIIRADGSVAAALTRPGPRHGRPASP